MPTKRELKYSDLSDTSEDDDTAVVDSCQPDPGMLKTIENCKENISDLNSQKRELNKKIKIAYANKKEGVGAYKYARSEPTEKKTGKKAQSAFLLFVASVKEEIKAKLKSAEFLEEHNLSEVEAGKRITKVGGFMWKKLSDEEKNTFTEQHKAMKKQIEEETKAFKEAEKEAMMCV